MMNSKSLKIMSIAWSACWLVACGSGVKYEGDGGGDDPGADPSTDMHADGADTPEDVPGDAPADAPVDTPADGDEDGVVTDTPGECGNGVPEEGEECDDGNDVNTDACTDGCLDAFCGDGYVWAGHEECEGTGTEACTTSCGSTGDHTCADCSWTECDPPSEICNGADDDCVDGPDNGFDCVRGTPTSCTTSCGSTGSGTCTSTCVAPGPDGCTPPSEICNGSDDDCVDGPDNGFDCVLGSSPSACTTTCGTSGTQPCDGSCNFGDCCAASETCGNGCDDDCDTVADDGCSTAPPNDTCSSPTDVTAGGRFTGNTDLATNDYWGTTGCSGYGPDVVFTFTLSHTSDVFITTYGSTFDTVVYVGSSCSGTGVACEDDSTTFGGGVFQEDVQIDNLAAGTYYIVLDGFYSYSHGDYRLDFYSSIGTAPGNRCSDPLPLNTNPVIGVTSSMLDNFSNTCGGGTASDHVYFLYVDATTTRTLSTCNGPTAFDTVLAIRDVCNNASTETHCNDNASSCMLTTPGASTITRSFSPGLYYVVIDGAGTSSGYYEIDN